MPAAPRALFPFIEPGERRRRGFALIYRRHYDCRAFFQCKICLTGKLRQRGEFYISPEYFDARMNSVSAYISLLYMPLILLISRDYFARLFIFEPPRG